MTPLHLASLLGHLPAVRVLIEASCDINKAMARKQAVLQIPQVVDYFQKVRPHETLKVS